MDKLSVINNIIESYDYKSNIIIEDKFTKACIENELSKIEKIIKKDNCFKKCDWCIHKLVYNNYYNIVKCLIVKNKKYIYLKNSFGSNIYTILLSKKSFNLIKLINELDTNINNYLYSYYRFNSLMIVNDYDIFKYLIDKSDINHTDIKGNNVLMIKLFYNINNNNMKIIELLIKKGANIYHKNNDGMNFFMYSCKKYNKDIIKLLLMNEYKYKNDLNELSKEKEFTDTIIIDNFNHKSHSYGKLCEIIKDIDIDTKYIKSSNIFSLIVTLNDNYFNLITNS